MATRWAGKEEKKRKLQRWHGTARRLEAAICSGDVVGWKLGEEEEAAAVEGDEVRARTGGDEGWKRGE